MSRSLTASHFSLLHVTVLLGGLTTLSIELAASRLVGAYFGVSNVVWTTIIGLILAYLAFGYYLGGRLADHSPQHSTFFVLAAWGAFLSGVVPFLGRMVLPVLTATGLPLPLAVAIAITVLYTLPITLLGCLSPFAIRLAFRTVQETGQVTGSVYAFSTLGSIVGSLAPGLYTLPTLGTTRTYLVFSTLLLVVALYGVARDNHNMLWKLIWMPIVFVTLVILAP